MTASIRISRRWWWLTPEGEHGRCERMIDRYADGRMFRCSNPKCTPRFCRVHRDEPSNKQTAESRLLGEVSL